MFDKLKSIKKGYVKSRDKPDQSLPYAKVQKRGKWIRRFVKIALVLVGLSGAIAFIKASNVSQTNHKLIAKMKTYDDKLEKASMGQSVYSPSLNRYVQAFYHANSDLGKLVYVGAYIAMPVGIVSLSNRVKPDGLGLVQYAISIATFGIKRILNRTVYYHDRVLPTGYFEESHMADTPIIVEKSKSHD